MSPPSPLRESALWAWLLAAVGMAGLTIGLVGWSASRAARAPSPALPLAPLAHPEQLPAPDDFPVRWGDQRLLGGRLGQTGFAFVVLEQVRGALAPGAPAPSEGESLLGLRLGAATDAEGGMDPEVCQFELSDTSGATYAPSAVSTPGRLLPGPALNLFEAYFPLPAASTPATVTIMAGDARLTLPASPVPAPEDPAP